MDANWYDLGAYGDSPGERVGATLSVLAVDFQSKHLRHAELETGTPLEPSSSDEQQYGLYLHLRCYPYQTLSTYCQRLERDDWL